MSAPKSSTVAASVRNAASELFATHISQERAQVSRIFVWLLIFQWFAVISATLWWSPRTWTGGVSSIHEHVWTALILGSLFTGFPLFLAHSRPAEVSTRHAVAIAQILMGSLLIHSSGGQIENHFHVFVSLAFLAFYRDVKVILTASLVVTVDHLARGVFFPQSIYGVLDPQVLRTLEHALWVIFEDVILIASCRHGLQQAKTIASRQAELQVTNEFVETRILERTREVQQGEKALIDSERNYRNLFDDSPVGMFRATPGGKVLLANARLLSMTGYGTLEEMKAVRLDIGSITDSLSVSPSPGVHGDLLPFETLWSRKGGSDLRVSGTARPFYDDHGTPIYLDGAVEDITDRSRADELERDRILVLEMVGQNRSIDEILEQIKTLLRRQIRRAKSSFHLYSKAGQEPNPWTIRLSSEGTDIGTLSVSIPESREPQSFERKAMEEASRLAVVAVDHDRLYKKLAHQASHDTLTNLPNRQLFESQLATILAQAKMSLESVAVFWLEIDRFKQINDTLGHQVGDALLREISNRLKSLLRPVDLVGRMGGDEFAIVVRHILTPEAAEQEAQNFFGIFEESLFIEPHQVSLTASLGMSLYPSHGENAAELLAHADMAMSHAKKEGVNRYFCFMPDMAKTVFRRKNLEQEMKNALRNQEFKLYYQPQVSLATKDCRAIIGVEALLRWTNPALGRVSPGEFIPIAEETGMILALGDWVLNEACRQSVEWSKAGLPPIRISVNVSALQFSRPDFIANLETVLARTGMDPRLLELELTETSLMQNLDETATKMQLARDLGMNIAIDDFGTGYCSLSYLQGLCASTLKVDQSFVRGISLDSPGRIAIVQAIVDMARSLELKVVAEGVETEYQFSVLEEIGCDVAQGYLLAKPLPRAELEELLIANGGTRAIYSLAQCLDETPETPSVPASEAA